MHTSRLRRFWTRTQWWFTISEDGRGRARGGWMVSLWNWGEISRERQSSWFSPPAVGCRGGRGQLSSSIALQLLDISSPALVLASSSYNYIAIIRGGSRGYLSSPWTSPHLPRNISPALDQIYQPCLPWCLVERTTKRYICSNSFHRSKLSVHINIYYIFQRKLDPCHLQHAPSQPIKITWTRMGGILQFLFVLLLLCHPSQQCKSTSKSSSTLQANPKEEPEIKGTWFTLTLFPLKDASQRSFGNTG